MKRLFTNLFLVALVIAPSALLSQNCRNIVKYCSHAKRDGFLRNGQSLSGAFAQGDTAEITFVVYKDMEYRISLCSPTHDELDGTFEFKIIEKITKPYWDEKEVSEAKHLNDKLINRALKIEGTSTGEHGIGIGKKEFLKTEQGLSVEIMSQIKKAIDPKNIMNPGKIFDIN